MNVEEIRQLVKIVEESDIGDLEVTRWGRKVRISKYPNHAFYPHFPQQIFVPDPQVRQNFASTNPSHSPASNNQNTTSLSAPARTSDAAGQKNLADIKSPMVGTFYRSPAPDAEPYVNVGDAVTKGQVLCIIEAMKLMNEIESDFPCRIVEILIETGQPVEYNQSLFRVEKL